MMRRYLLAFALFALLPGAVLAAGAAFADPAAPRAPVRVVVPVHDIARGDVIADSDLTFATMEGSALPPSTVTNVELLKGMQARRALRAGEALRTEDVRRPVVVTRGQTVTMQFAAPGVELTAMGRAMGEGGVGDTVTVQNPVSFRMINATIIGPGTVRAGSALPSPFELTARK